MLFVLMFATILVVFIIIARSRWVACMVREQILEDSEIRFREPEAAFYDIAQVELFACEVDHGFLADYELFMCLYGLLASLAVPTVS